MKKLAHKVALVTGAESGIGQAIAVEFAREGADVLIAYHADQDGAAQTRERVEAAGQKAVLVQADVGDCGQAQRLFERATEAFTSLDILVNNAGTNGAHKPVVDMVPEEFEHTLRTNLFGPFYLCRLFARHRREHGGRGKILNVTSIHEEVVQPNSVDYCASKGGLRSLTRTLALELAGDGINVNNVAPGMILTPINQQAIGDPAARREEEHNIPWRRAGRPDEVARLALFLASEDADYVTGSTYVMDGGLMRAVAQGA